jgi:Domain of unknown function (DUF305)
MNDSKSFKIPFFMVLSAARNGRIETIRNRDAFNDAGPRNVPLASQDVVMVAAGTGGTAVALTFGLSAGSHLAAIAVGAVAAAAYLTVYPASPQSLADYISAICAKSFGSAPAAEAPYLAENVSAMTKMMIDMGIRPSGDVDADFVAMMVPHHQGAIEMAQAELRYGHNEPLRRMAQEIIVTQLQEITAMRLSLGQALPPSIPSPDQIPPAAMNDSKSGSAALVKEP